MQPAAPGFAKIRIAPQPGPLNKVSGEVPTPRGPVRLEMSKTGGRWTLKASAPSGIPVTVVLPGAEAREFPDGGEISL
jgi:alpha-L-rhamnosidase